MGHCYDKIAQGLIVHQTPINYLMKYYTDKALDFAMLGAVRFYN